MIKDVMVRLDGTEADEMRLAVADTLVDTFQGHVIGLFLNVLPLIIPPEGDSAASIYSVKLMEEARELGDRTEAKLTQRLARLQKPVELRRFDVFSDTIGDVAAREARSADTFVGLRPNGESREPENLLESVLFGSGRHLFVVPGVRPGRLMMDNIMVAWNATRESARAMAEAMPYLRKAKQVAVVSVVDEEVEDEAVMGQDAVNHLRHHGISATLHHAKKEKRDVGETLIAEAHRVKADVIVMGGYGHSRLREWLLGGATYEMMHKAPVPLVIAH
jgi:nucleotide-binding universal stress UspA family protein